jgi:hypothetical protein
LEFDAASPGDHRRRVGGKQEAIFMTPPTCVAAVAKSLSVLVIPRYPAVSMAPATSEVAERSRILVMLRAKKTGLSILFSFGGLPRLGEHET